MKITKPTNFTLSGMSCTVGELKAALDSHEDGERVFFTHHPGYDQRDTEYLSGTIGDA
jgi:hypothetical protein